MPALLVLISLLPGILSPIGFYPWMSFQHEVWLFASFMTVAAMIIWRSWWSPQASLRCALSPMAFVLLAVMALQCALKPNFYLGDLVLGFVYISGVWVAWQFGLQHDTAREDHFKALTLTWVALALVSALMAMVQFCELQRALDPWVITPAGLNRATANLAQPNNLATFLMMGIVATVWLYDSKVFTGSFALVCVLVMSLGVLTAQSRTALLTALGMLILKILMSRKKMLNHIQTYKVCIWFVLMLVCSWAIRRATTYDVFQLNPPASSEGRLIIWHQLLVAVQQAPWLGYGWLQTPAAQQIGAMQVPGSEQTTYSHNLVLDLCVWLGVPLGLLLSVSAAYWLLKRWRHATQARTLMAFGFLLPLGVHSMLELPFAYAYFLFPAAWVLGMIDRDTSPNHPSVSGLRARLEASLAAVFIFLALGIAWEFVKVEEDFRMARFEKQNIGFVPAEYVRPNLVILDQWRDLLTAMRTPIKPDMSPEQLELLERSSQRFSWLALHVSYALALDLNEHPKEAERQRKLIKGLFGDESHQYVLQTYRMHVQTQYPQLKKITVE